MAKKTTEARRSYIHELVGTLRQERDHLKVQFELGKMEVRDDWQQLEKKWQHVQSRADAIGDDVEDSLEDLAEELKSAYQKLKSRLSD